MIANLGSYPGNKDSGVEWMGLVPEHWEARRVKGLAKPGYKTFVDGDWIESPYIASNGIRLIQTGNIGVGEYIEKGFRFISLETFDNFGCTEVEPDDVLICRLGDPVARACLAPHLAHRMITSVDVCILKPGEHANAQYLVYAMSCLRYLNWVRSLVRGSTRDRVSRSMLGSFSLPLPPLREQTAIVRFLDHADRRIRHYIRAKERLIELLEEQKQAIIHQAVTGQIDVRTGQPYPAYKDSGVEWLGYVPMHWQSRRLKTLCDMQSGDAITAMSIEETGQYPVFGGNGIRGFSSNYTHDGDFVLIGRQGALCGNVHVVCGRFWASEHAIVATLRRYHIHEWFGALLELMNLNQYSIAAAQPGLSIDRILNLQAPVPPTSEQRAISRHLVAMTAAMQETVTATGREIELVSEYRTRLIADVVTGKLDVREAAAGLPDVDRRGAKDDPDDGFDGEAGSEAAVWRHGVDEGSSLVPVSDAGRSEVAEGELMTEGRPSE